MKINDFTEDSPYAMFKRWASKTSQPRQYEKAAQTLHNVLVKKSRNGNLKHGLGYYAQQIGKTFAACHHVLLSCLDHFHAILFRSVFLYHCD